MPFGVQDIGSFQMCFELVGGLAIVTNSALVTWTMEGGLFPDSMQSSEKIWAFWCTQVVLQAVMQLVRIYTPDTPEDVRYQRLRQKFLVSKIIDQVSCARCVCELEYARNATSRTKLNSIRTLIITSMVRLRQTS